MIDKIIQRQVNFQRNMKSNSGVMKKALIEELGEYVASTGYADWKQVVRDEANMAVEMIDMAVFAINLAFYEDSITPGYAVTLDKKILNEDDLIDEIIYLIATQQWLRITYTIFDYDPSLTHVIIAKQALNTMRQDYGYRTGDYVKDWNGQEDNTYLEGFYGKTYEEVYEGMESIYTDKILAARLVNVHD